MTIQLFGKMVNIDPRFGNNFIDANVLDRKGSPEDNAVDAILRYAEAGEFTLLLPYSVKEELEHPNTPKEIKRRAAGLIFSMRVQLTEQEKATHRRIRDLIRGNAQSNQHDRDAFHLVESQKNGGRHFITNDGRLLKKAAEIWQALLIRVLTPKAFMNDYFPGP
jgi:hypothetical protein